MTSVKEIDTAFARRAGGLVDSRIGRWTARILAHSGDSQWWLIAGGLMWRFGAGGWDQAGRRIVFITLVGALVSGSLKRIIRRARPNGEPGLLYLEFDRHSFPSGHATRIGGLVVVLGASLPLWGTLGMIAWGLAVGYSRIALGVHHASDIAAGLILGAILGAGLLLTVF